MTYNQPIKKFFIYVVATALTLIIIFPVFWLFSASMKSGLEMFRIPPVWLPKFSLENFRQAFRMRPLLEYITNSVLITAITTVITVPIGSLAGYGFSRFNFRGNKLIMFIILSSRMIPAITLIFPLYLMMRDLHLLDTHLSLIIAYTTLNLPFAIFLMYTFFMGVTSELEEAAMIDGCSRISSFFRIILPISLPGLISTSIMCILFAWKDFLFALRFTYTTASQTIPIGVTTYMATAAVDWGSITAVGTLSVLPLLIFSLIVQKNMVSGLMAGAVKG